MRSIKSFTLTSQQSGFQCHKEDLMAEAAATQGEIAVAVPLGFCGFGGGQVARGAGGGQVGQAAQVGRKGLDRRGGVV
jgi:hypothetical protein